METRVCRKCKIEKPLSEFNKNGKYYRTECKECKKTYEHDQYLKNRDRVLERNRIHDREHAEERRQYRERNKEHIKNYYKEYREKNLERIREHNREYNLKNAEEIKEKQRKFREENKELILEYKKNFYEKNPHYHRDYDKRKIKEDELYKFKKLVRNMIRFSFFRKGLRKTKGTKHIVGCDYKFLKEYLLETYKKNYGEEWNGKEPVHIDHIIPLSNAKNEEEIIKLCHYTNLQLLKAKDNLEKSDNTEWELKK